MKLHWCCGDVYLKGFVNIDIKGIKKKCPAGTTLDRYYTSPFSKDFDKRKRNEFVIDRKLNILKRWPFKNESVAMIVMISCWEHFTKQEVQHIQKEIQRVLKPGGCFIVDFPDIKKDVELYYDDPEYLMELIYCNWKNKYSIHKWGYTVKSFKQMWDSKKYKVKRKTIVKHDYPMIGMEVIKL